MESKPLGRQSIILLIICPLYSLLFAKIWVRQYNRADMKINNIIHTLTFYHFVSLVLNINKDDFPLGEQNLNGISKTKQNETISICFWLTQQSFVRLFILKILFKDMQYFYNDLIRTPAYTTSVLRRAPDFAFSQFFQKLSSLLSPKYNLYIN